MLACSRRCRTRGSTTFWICTCVRGSSDHWPASHRPPGGFGEQYPSSYPELAEYQYQAAWRTSQWTLPSKVTQLLESKEQAGFHESAFGALRSLHDGDRATFLASLRFGVQPSPSDTPSSRGRCGLLQELLAADLLESTKYVHPVLSRLRFFSEVERAWPLLWNSAEGAVRLGVTQVQRTSDNSAALARMQEGWKRYNCAFPFSADLLLCAAMMNWRAQAALKSRS
jgi:hypothetical protein